MSYIRRKKTLSVLTPLVDAFAPESGLVLDPFAGSTLVAAKMLSRRYLGIELDRAHCAVARRRLAREVSAAAIGSERAIRP